jgi:hypothetical protein
VALKQYVGLFKILLEYQPLLDVTTEIGANRRAHLHFSVAEQNKTSMQLLLEKGANPDIGMGEDITPSHHVQVRAGSMELKCL